jgi:hypothetical protein
MTNKLYKQLIAFGNFATPPSEKLYKEACLWIGKDASPLDKAPDDLGCAETINYIHKQAFSSYIGGGVSTTKLFFALDTDNTFTRVMKPIRGDIIICPTGYGNGEVSNGHTGIIGDNGLIMSNNSKTGKFDIHLTLADWRLRYQIKGGYPTYYFRKVLNS